MSQDLQIMRRAMYDAYQLLQTAHTKYEEALSVYVDTERLMNGHFAIQQAGREYAEAVTRYSDAVMSFLALMETKRKSIPQRASQVCGR